MKLERFTPRTLSSAVQLRKNLSEVRRSGYALDDEEAGLGSRCVSAPILDVSGKVAAAISVSGPTARIGREKVQIFAGAVREAARTISARLGYLEKLPD